MVEPCAVWETGDVNDHGSTERIAALTKDQRVRAVGSVVAAATGDALGAPYEFLAPIPDSDDVEMVGGGVLDWGPGEWTDDTAMAIVVLEAALAHPTHDLRSPEALDLIARDWHTWAQVTPDIGALTSTVVRKATDVALAAGRLAPCGEDYAHAARLAHEQLPLAAGNGALMRVHASVLPSLLGSEDDTAEMVSAVCALTHAHPDVAEACLLWGMAIRHAVLSGELDVRCGLRRLEPERAEVWDRRIQEAEDAPPSAFRRNGWVVGAFQAAWSSIHRELPLPEGRFARREALSRALESAVRVGYDTDTVACITGALMGAALGRKAVAPEWRRELFGWPEQRIEDLESLVERLLDAISEGSPDSMSVPDGAPGHGHDPHRHDPHGHDPHGHDPHGHDPEGTTVPCTA